MNEQEAIQQETYDIMEVCLLAGRIMIQSGAETYRVEDTMTRIAYAYGARESHCYVTPTGIIFSIESSEPTKTKLIRISERTTDLRKVTRANSISRQITAGELSLEQAYRSFKSLQGQNETYSLWAQVVAAAISSGCFMIMFRGSWIDFIPAVFVGGLGFIAYIYFQRILEVKFFAEFLGSFVIGLASFGLVSLGLGDQIDKIIIGSVMPLVPGLLLTNAVRDLMAGHLVSGISKGAEAFLTAFAIGAGIAVVLSFFV